MCADLSTFLTDTNDIVLSIFTAHIKSNSQNCYEDNSAHPVFKCASFDFFIFSLNKHMADDCNRTWYSHWLLCQQIHNFVLFFKMGHFRPFFFLLTFSIQLTLNVQFKFWRWTDSNCGPRKLEVTALPNEPQPLPNPALYLSAA